MASRGKESVPFEGSVPSDQSDVIIGMIFF